MIQVGDRVVCVDASDTPLSYGGWVASGLVLGREYIVYAIVGCHDFGFDVGIAYPDGSECPLCHRMISKDYTIFNRSRFRKVEDRTIEYSVDVQIETPLLIEDVLS
jgi:hypothetical protein